MNETPSIDDLLELVKNDAWDTLAEHFQHVHPVDIAELIGAASYSQQGQIFGLVDDAVKPDVLAELEGAVDTGIIESLPIAELSDIVEDMAPDDAADLLAEIPEERSAQVLQLMEEEESEDVRRLLQYKEDSAGGIMTTDVVSMREEQSVQEALDAIAHLDTREQFFHANIIDTAGRMIGFIDVWELLREKQRTRPLGELVHREFKAATVDMDQEKVAQIMHRYDLTVIPVVDDDGTLIGRITSDDVIDVIEEEASEDIFRLAGSDDVELDTTSPLTSCAARLPWLLVTLVGGLISAMILRNFHARISHTLVLAAFVPVVMAMGGNAGIQSSTLVVRSLALGAINRRNVLWLLIKEIISGALMGIACGVIIGVLSAIFVAMSPETSSPLLPQHLAAILGLALFCAMTFAAVFGAVVPILLHRVKIDPAVASGPFVSITNDIIALLIYFAITTLFIYKLS
jgi:magnesium transporter